MAAADKSASIRLLALHLVWPRREIIQAILALDRAGLVDAAHVRLTLSGLAVAVATSPTPRRAAA